LKKIAIANRKGGVGKTTTAVHIAAALALAGEKTLLIDTDTQAHCSRILGMKPDTTLSDYIGGKGSPVQARDLLDLLAGSKALGAFSQIQPERRHRREMILSEALEGLNDYQYVILDTPPGFSDLSVNVLFYADSVIIPVSMEVLAVEGLFNLREELEEIQRYKPIEIRAIVPTFVDGRVGKTETILGQLREAFGKVVTLPIHYSTRFSELPAWGQTIYEYDPKGRGSIDYAKVAGAIA
jgi:chromosome partitioning protein